MYVNVNSRWYDHDPYVFATQADKVFYLDDKKLGHPWKVVQKIQYRHVWDILERDDDQEYETSLEEEGNDEVSDEESDEEVAEITDMKVQVDDEETDDSLRREDVEPETIPLSRVYIERNIVDDNDSTGEIGDDVVMEDVISSGEDQVIIGNDNDSDN